MKGRGSPAGPDVTSPLAQAWWSEESLSAVLSSRQVVSCSGEREQALLRGRSGCVLCGSLQFTF